jgi:DNA-binding beta-propeller fold protein YncE
MKPLIVVAMLLILGAPAFAGTNHIFVSNEKGGGFSVPNATDYTTVGQIKTGARPRGMVFSPDHTLLYVTCGGVNRIDIVDVAAMKVIGASATLMTPRRSTSTRRASVCSSATRMPANS